MIVERIAAGMCAWLATYLIHSTLLLGIAWVATHRLSTRFEEIAELAWRAAVGLPVVTSLAQHLLAGGTGASAGMVSTISYSPSPLEASAVPAALWIAVVAIWIGGATLGLGHLWRLHAQLGRQIRDRRPLDPEKARALGPLSVKQSVRITVVDGLGVPFALAREICLPDWLVDRLPESELRAAVAHEMAHVRRHDAFWRSGISAIARAFFFQPLNWVAAARLRELSECICDDEAVAATRSSVSLAMALETVARKVKRQARHASLAPAMGAPASLTLRRVERILSTPGVARQRAKVGRGRRAALVAIAAVAATVLAPSVRVPALTFMRYTINGEDPAGRFTITVEKGRVIGATLADRRLSPREVRQRGADLVLADGKAVPLSVRLTPQGGIRWNARAATTPTTH
jgi:beta-lactamase regulating signal transducer with metallopeptidase domain